MKAARWIGERLLDHDHRPTCPCHRVVRKDGSPGLYITGNTREKLGLLRAEGVEVADGKVKPDFPDDRFTTDRPLTPLLDLQCRVPQELKLTPLRKEPRTLGGLDVAYVDRQTAVAAYVQLDAESLETVWKATLPLPVRFPYVSGYLAFRELPALLALAGHARAENHWADLVFVDGNGILHPRRAGIAACFGLLAETPTIGIGKTLLCGSVDVTDLAAGEPRLVMHEEEPIGAALKCRSTSRPFFASPGNLVTLDDAVRWSRHCLTDNRLPEPIQRADRLSKQEVRDARKQKE
ncbi:Endonuclease V [Maioricimonas rarisocia]|uniref:Endonuclease V n=1 Tax=Maioricimonas rarisocia TaxID=2528026 RepID=A0A517ZDX5_9PLAN|nr:Endonuclease V [Maioricimonas rarisocia]